MARASCTLTGSDSLANYQSVLDSVTYSSSVADARGANGADPSRTIDWSASDGTSQSAVATSTVTIPDAAPVVTAGAAVSYTEQGAAVKLDSGLTVTDIDNATLTGATVSIAAGFLAGDTLAATTTGTSITQGYNISSGVLTLTGSDTLAHYKTVLEFGDLQLERRRRARRQRRRPEPHHRLERQRWHFAKRHRHQHGQHP